MTRNLAAASAAVGVAVARLAADVDVDRFAHQAENDRVLANVIADADSVIADLGAGPFAGATVPAVDVLSLPHFLGDDAAELESCAAGGVLLHPVVPLDDLDIDAGGVFDECAVPRPARASWSG